MADSQPTIWTTELRRMVATACVFTLLGAIGGYALANLNRLGPITYVSVAEGDIEFAARLDSGATVSSINAHDIEVVGGSGIPQRSDAGKAVRFTLDNGEGQRTRVEAVIDQVRGIKTADCRELRYHVYLTMIHRGTAYRILTNLNDRSASKDKLLLGRNWLRHGFVVDVSRT